MKKISIYVIVVFIFAILVSCSNVKNLSLSEIEKLRDDFPFCENLGQNMSLDVAYLKAVDLEDMVTKINGPIIIGEIINKLDNLTVDTSSYDEINKDINESIMENRGYNVMLQTYVIYEIKISEIVRGDSEIKTGQTIKIAIPAFLDATGPYEKDLKGVFIISNFTSPLLKEYYQTSRFGFLYITDDNYVLGAYPNKLSEDYSGVSLEYLKTEIEKLF